MQAVAGEAPIAVTGEDGREALAVALTIVHDIERSLPGAVRAADGDQSCVKSCSSPERSSGDLHASGVARELVARARPVSRSSASAATRCARPASS